MVRKKDTLRQAGEQTLLGAGGNKQRVPVATLARRTQRVTIELTTADITQELHITQNGQRRHRVYTLLKAAFGHGDRNSMLH